MIDGFSDTVSGRMKKVALIVPKAKDIASKCRLCGLEHLPRWWMMRAVFVGETESSARNYTRRPTDRATASYA